MQKYVFETPDLLGQNCAIETSRLLNQAMSENGSARLVMSTGMSQFETIEHLLGQNVDWTKIEMFHLDEYIGVGSKHPASFVKYLRERFADKIRLKRAYYIDGLADPSKVIEELTAEIAKKPIDVALIGIGENGHIAFNDPPADFGTEESFIIVDLDDDCKAQQVREGWFASAKDVPVSAITMTVHQIMQAKSILSAVPHKQKADAIKAVLQNPVSPMIPATILKTHPNWKLYLDAASAGGEVA